MISSVMFRPPRRRRGVAATEGDINRLLLLDINKMYVMRMNIHVCNYLKMSINHNADL